MEPEASKRCSKCGVIKFLSKFYKSAYTKSGRRSYCSECAKVMKADYLGRVMNIKNLEKQINGLSIQEKKIFDAVPLLAMATTSQIVTEINRKTGSRPDHKTVKGILVKLENIGILRQPKHDFFIRVNASGAGPKELPEKAESIDVPVSKSEFENQINGIFDIIKCLRNALQSLEDDVMGLSIGIETKLNTETVTDDERQLLLLMRKVGSRHD